VNFDARPAGYKDVSLPRFTGISRNNSRICPE
jgi:hypothetical protein